MYLPYNFWWSLWSLHPHNREFSNATRHYEAGLHEHDTASAHDVFLRHRQKKSHCCIPLVFQPLQSVSFVSFTSNASFYRSTITAWDTADAVCMLRSFRGSWSFWRHLRSVHVLVRCQGARAPPAAVRAQGDTVLEASSSWFKAFYETLKWEKNSC